MSKRRITRRQAWRIDKIQEERRLRAEKKEKTHSEFLAGKKLGPEQHGLLITRYGTMASIEDTSGKRFSCQLRQHLGNIVTGDVIIWRPMDENTGVIVAREKRRNILGKPDKHGTMKAVCANIDQLLIVIAPEPHLSTYLIDSYLVAAETLTIPPLLILNKADLLTKEQEKTIKNQLAIYSKLLYPILFVSSHLERGLEKLEEKMRDKISVLVGQSGVGKSSIINALLPTAFIQTTALSTQSGHGQHTTTASTLYHLPKGGSLIDSPGIRNFALWHMEPKQIAHGFVEFRPFLGHCRFRNCQHHEEPGCALQKAVAEGAIDRERLKNYFKVTSTI